ncbi:MAG: 50S ribosomal protein L13 [Desulfovibrionales bacterium GWA2_65_9]|nr:50S ribosomal protein L13 [Pseudomonadota bacterium]OGR34543.1 MAG: 50S ribosomal protein L13 [Desulfovibrionales bacterium GWA2_65_9]
MNTYSPVPSDLKHEWFVVDATEQILGRLATAIAHRIRGKHKPGFAPHMDGGDFIVVVNATKIKVTGDKLNKKMYYKHTLFTGGLKSRNLKQMLEKNPELVIIQAVRGMLPKNRLSRQIIKKLKVFAGPEHTHVAQKPQALAL